MRFKFFLAAGDLGVGFYVFEIASYLYEGAFHPPVLFLATVLYFAAGLRFYLDIVLGGLSEEERMRVAIGLPPLN